MSPERKTEVSKFLSFVLRHEPEAIGLSLDSEGWASVQALLDGAATAGQAFTSNELFEIVSTSDKKRFLLSDDKLRIRAVHGHSVAIENKHRPKLPPAILFHGTATRFVEAILKEGLNAQGRQFVHLSTTREQAFEVGSRHGKPVILSIDASGLANSGVDFFESESGVWLVNSVPSSFLTLSSHHEH